jgi:hypothetical protein
LWEACHGGTDSDELFSVHPTSDGGYLLGGISVSPVSGAKAAANGTEAGEYWVVKTDATGRKEWEQVIHAGFPAETLRAEPAADGGILIPGLCSLIASPDQNYSLIKLSAPVRLGAATATMPNNVFRTQHASIPGVTYVLEASTNLTGWTPVLTNRATSNVLQFTHTSGAAVSKRFYRVREQ